MNGKPTVFLDPKREIYVGKVPLILNVLVKRKRNVQIQY
jgi:hypothetical protein